MLELIGQKVPGPLLGGTAPTKGYPPPKISKKLSPQKM